MKMVKPPPSKYHHVRKVAPAVSRKQGNAYSGLYSGLYSQNKHSGSYNNHCHHQWWFAINTPTWKHRVAQWTWLLMSATRSRILFPVIWDLGCVILCTNPSTEDKRFNLTHIVFATRSSLGKPPLTKMDEFSENFQTASDPPPLLPQKSAT